MLRVAGHRDVEACGYEGVRLTAVTAGLSVRTEEERVANGSVALARKTPIPFLPTEDG